MGSYSAVTIAVVPLVAYRACLAPRLHEWNYSLSGNICLYVCVRAHIYVYARVGLYGRAMNGGGVDCTAAAVFYVLPFMRARLSYYIIGVLNGASFLFLQTVNIIFACVSCSSESFPKILFNYLFRSTPRNQMHYSQKLEF